MPRPHTHQDFKDENTEHWSSSLGGNLALIWGRSSLLQPPQNQLGPHWCKHKGENTPREQGGPLSYPILNVASKWHTSTVHALVKQMPGLPGTPVASTPGGSHPLQDSTTW